MLTRIRNGQMASKSAVNGPGLEAALATCSRCCGAKATSAATRRSTSAAARRELSIELKYHNGEPVIRELRRVSKPGRRIYAGRQGPAAGL